MSKLNLNENEDNNSLDVSETVISMLVTDIVDEICQ